MHLTQEEYKGDAWGVLVTCLMLNKTAGKMANPVIREILRRWSTPSDYLSSAENETVIELIRPLGLFRTRERRLGELAEALFLGKPYDQIPGVGKYGRDSYMIFVEGRLDLNPTDAKLKAYLNHRKSIRERRKLGRKQK